MKTNYREKHEFEDDNQPHDFRGMGLCMCGLPEDNPLHLTPKQTTGEKKKENISFPDLVKRTGELFSKDMDRIQYLSKKEERKRILDELEEKLKGMRMSGSGNSEDNPFLFGQVTGFNEAISDILTLVSKMRNKV